MMQTRFIKRAVWGELAAAAMLAAGAAQAQGVPGQGTWETTLQPRELDGNPANGPEAFYDTTLDITWLRDANANGLITWDSANTWANTLVVNGVSGWRLPTMIDTGAPGCDLSYAGSTDCGYNVQTKSGNPAQHEAGQTVYSEMAHLWYVTLGNKAYCPPGDATCAGGPQAGWGLMNTGGFQNVQSGDYWSGLESAPDPGDAWYFVASAGWQVSYGKGNGMFALAVRPGDVAAVPEPQGAALMLIGLTGLALALRRRPR